MKEFITNKVLMVRPIAFGYNEETGKDNLYQIKENSSADAIEKSAEKEFDAFVEKLRAATIDVIVLQDTLTPHTPDSIFPNNWFSTHSNNTLVLYPMYAENRRLERTDKILEFVKDRENLKIVDLTENEKRDRFLEGTGSICLDRKNKIAYANISKRTNKELFNEFCETMGYRGVTFSGFQTINGQKAPIYHTNVMLTIAENFAIVFLNAVEDEKERSVLKDSIINSGKELIEISEEQTKHFLGNTIELKKVNGDKILVMSKTAYEALTEEQKNIIEKYDEILYADIHTIETNGGGSARCMIAEWFL